MNELNNYKCNVSFNHPENTESWNQICSKNGNLLQTTLHDQIQDFYHQKPVYFQVLCNNLLVGGLKLYFWQSKYNSLKRISSLLYQLSEFIYDVSSISFENCRTVLSEHVNAFIKQHKIVCFECSNFYGSSESLMTPFNMHASKGTPFNVGYVNLKQGKLLISTFNRNTKRNIKKAEDNFVSISTDDDISKFNRFLKLIFEQQNLLSKCPNPDYVERFYEIYKKTDSAQIYYANKDGQPFSAVLISTSGKYAYSNFGGTIKNNWGTGQFMYFKIMEIFQNSYYERFYFGQIAREEDDGNLKFTKGISGFKKGFDCVELPSAKNRYIILKFRYFIWNTLLRILKMK